MDTIASQHSKNDFSAFWKSTNKMNVRPGLPASINGVNDPKDVANLFRDHFLVRSPLGPSKCYNAETITDQVGDRISAKQVAKAIKSLSRGKSPGHDGLSIEHLRYAGPHINRLLGMLFTLCIRHSYLPVDMIRTIVVPVVKNKTGDLSDINNYRPISLATVIAKVFDSILNARFNSYLKIHDNQFGFRPGLSTESAILCLKSTIKYYMDRNTPVYACFLDLSKAFDLVSYDILWEKLRNLRVPSEIIQIFKYWYSSQINCVGWSGCQSDPYVLECGVRQGGLSSPALFNLYINGLIEALSSMHIGCFVHDVCVNNISYADDMVLLSASPCGIRRLLNVCELYAEDHGLKYNSQKSQFMVFGAGRRCRSDVPDIRLNGTCLLQVHELKYLGHVLVPDLKDNCDMERERRALCVRANMIARRFARCSGQVKLTLFRAYCTSLYTCALWRDHTQRARAALRVQFNNAFRVLLGLPRYCSASGMFADAHTDCFYATIRKRCASLVRRVWDSPNTILRMIGGRVDCPYIRHCCGLHVPIVKRGRNL